MPKYQALILDIDGTFVDTYPSFFECMLATAEKNGWPIDGKAIAAIGQNFGVPTDCFARACWPDTEIDLVILQAAFDIFNETVMPPLFDGVHETFDKLRHDVHICTGRLRRPAVALLAHHEIFHRFIRVVTRSDVSRCKPDPEGLLKIIDYAERYRIPREHILMVGDCWESDGRCADAAGIDFLAVAESAHAPRQGFLDRGVPERMIIDRFRDLPDWLAAS